MATKKEKRAAALAKRHQFFEDTRQAGLKALKRDREIRERRKQQIEAAKKRKDAANAAKVIANGTNPVSDITSDEEGIDLGPARQDNQVRSTE